jgi:hypothetical protein
VEGVEYFAVPPPNVPRTIPGKTWNAFLLKLGRYERYYWSRPEVQWCLSALAAARPAVIVANDVATLPVALKLDSRFGVILDAHEYAPRELEDRIAWRLFFQRYNEYLCREYLPKVAGMTTVCQSIADAYRVN